MCKYSDDTGYECPHENLEDNDCCIFHLQDDQKDIIEFNEGINKIFETEKYSINFNGFYFPPKTADFSKREISGNISFNKAIFTGQTFFVETIFSKRVEFSDAEFKTDVDFYGATFTDRTSFLGTIFSNYVYISKANFLGEVYFHETVFLQKAFFRQTIFEKDVSFIEATFSDVLFNKTKFLGSVINFNEASFSGVTYFDKTVFSCDVHFDKAKFYAETYLKVKLLKNVRFYRTQIHAKFEFIFNESKSINFHNTYFSDGVRIKGDLSKSYFQYSNIERVDMTDSIWMRVDNKPKNFFSAFYEWIRNKMGLPDTSIIIWEEYQGELKSNWKELEGIYRRLKQSYQKYGDSETAGEFYYQEMECKRNQLKMFRKLFWDVVYKKLCGYGEKPFNVIGYSGLIILASSLFFFYNGIELLGSKVLDVPPRLIDYNLSFDYMWGIRNFNLWIGDFGACLYTSVITFTTLGYGDVHPIGYSRFVASVEAGFGIIMTALFIFVFTRKMLR